MQLYILQNRGYNCLYANVGGHVQESTQEKKKQLHPI